MTKDDIIKLARDAGVRDDGYRFEFSEFRHLERFFKAAYAAGAAAEREQCAKLFEPAISSAHLTYAAAIRARNKS